MLLARLLLVAAALTPAGAIKVGANPVRKIVTVLQNMAKMVEQEGERDEQLFETFICYCRTAGGSLANSIAAAEDKIPTLESEKKATEEERAFVDSQLTQASKDRDDANSAIAEAESMREKQGEDYAKTRADYQANIAAVGKAIAALEKGIDESFLQTALAGAMRKLIASDKVDLSDGDRFAIKSFLDTSADSDYAPQSGEIIGILKQMQDEMTKGLADATGAESASIKNFNEQMVAKTKEVDSLAKIVESKSLKRGELSVQAAQQKNDLTDTKESLAQDQKTLAEMQKSCAKKDGEMQQMRKLRQEELKAITETITLLNDDDALDLFKKALPSSSASSFPQIRASFVQVRSRARHKLKHRANRAGHKEGLLLHFVAQALHGKKVKLGKVIAMIDDMVATLQSEQKQDDDKKTYCEKELDIADDEKKFHERGIKDSKTAINAAKDGIALAEEEIEALVNAIKTLDKSVQEATEQREKEHDQYKEDMSQNAAAKNLIMLAKRRLNKFYNPKLALVQGGAHAPPPPPPEVAGAYQKKNEESGGVIQMMNLLLNDLETDAVDAKADEENSQADYDKLMRDSANKRTLDAKALDQKESTKADLEENLQTYKDELKDGTDKFMATDKHIMALHAECDFLAKYFDVRKTMRAQDVEALKRAKAVLEGADFS